jgi:hypothetical protein
MEKYQPYAHRNRRDEGGAGDSICAECLVAVVQTERVAAVGRDEEADYESSFLAERGYLSSTGNWTRASTHTSSGGPAN